MIYNTEAAPLLTILVPVRNEAAHIRECLEDVKALLLERLLSEGRAE